MMNTEVIFCVILMMVTCNIHLHFSVWSKLRLDTDKGQWLCAFTQDQSIDEWHEYLLLAIDIISILDRFETQEDTGKHLQELQNRAEKEIRDLGAVKEKLEAEWELVKFMGQEENTELREKLEILEEDIQDQQVRELWK